MVKYHESIGLAHAAGIQFPWEQQAPLVATSRQARQIGISGRVQTRMRRQAYSRWYREETIDGARQVLSVVYIAAKKKFYIRDIS